MIGQGFYAVVQAFLSITPAAVYLIAGLLLANGQPISAGTIVAFTTLQTRLYFPIGQLLQVSVELRSSLALFDRIFEYLDLRPDIVDAPDAVDLPSVATGGRVALRDVHFRYAGVPDDALRGVSFEADPGQLVALVGPSGAGKTTISYLIPEAVRRHRRVDRDRRDRRAAGPAGLAGHRHRVRDPGELPVPRHDPGQPGVRPARRLARGDRGGGPGGVHPRPDHAVPRRLRHAGGRARLPAVRRGEAAAGHRPGPAARPAHPDPGRGDVGAGHGQRARGAEGPGRADGVADHDRDRAPAVHHRQRRRDQRHRRRPVGGVRVAPGPAPASAGCTPTSTTSSSRAAGCSGAARAATSWPTAACGNGRRCPPRGRGPGPASRRPTARRSCRPRSGRSRWRRARPAGRSAAGRAWGRCWCRAASTGS